MRYGSAHIAGDAIVYRRRCLLSLFIAGSICALTWQLSAAAEVTEPKFTQEDRDFWLWVRFDIMEEHVVFFIFAQKEVSIRAGNAVDGSDFLSNEVGQIFETVALDHNAEV